MDRSAVLQIFRHSISAFCIYIIAFPANAHLFEASGDLSALDGIDGAGLTTLSWDVLHPDGDGTLHTNYTYTFEHAPTGTFEFIIEVHPNMLSNPGGVAIYDVSSTLPNWELGVFAPSASTPGMPDTMPGVRFWGDSASTTETISFRSDFTPMWGDFYGTSTNPLDAAWNTGFTNPDTDPLQPASDGSVDFHLLVPGAGGIPIIPVPPAVWLFGSGLLGLVGMARRKQV